MVIHFKLSDKDQVPKLNKIASKYPFDIWIHSEDRKYDANSILSLYTLPFKKDLKLVVEEDEGVNSTALLEDMKAFR